MLDARVVRGRNEGQTCRDGQYGSCVARASQTTVVSGVI